MLTSNPEHRSPFEEPKSIAKGVPLSSLSCSWLGMFSLISVERQAEAGEPVSQYGLIHGVFEHQENGETHVRVVDNFCSLEPVEAQKRRLYLYEGNPDGDRNPAKLILPAGLATERQFSLRGKATVRFADAERKVVVTLRMG